MFKLSEVLAPKRPGFFKKAPRVKMFGNGTRHKIKINNIELYTNEIQSSAPI